MLQQLPNYIATVNLTRARSYWVRTLAKCNFKSIKLNIAAAIYDNFRDVKRYSSTNCIAKCGWMFS